MPKWLTLKNLVDVAGIAGFLMSIILAILQFRANRLRVSAMECTLIETTHARDSVFLYVCLNNKTRQPFSLVDVCIDAGGKLGEIPVKKTVRTYPKGDPGKRAPTGPVVLSPAFPVRFDSYAAEVFLFEVARQHIDIKSFHLDAPVDSQAELPYRQSPRTHRPCKHRPRIRLKLYTSRGRLSVSAQIASVQGWEWLERYAVQKAGHEEKILFP